MLFLEEKVRAYGSVGAVNKKDDVKRMVIVWYQTMQLKDGLLGL